MSVIQPSGEGELREALALLMGRTGVSSTDIETQIDLLLHYADKYQLSLDHCLVAKEKGKVIAACLCVDSPGRTSSLFVPSKLDGSRICRLVVQLLQETARLAQDRNVQLLQGMVAPEADREATIYRQAGFEYLTRMVYLERDLTKSVAIEAKIPVVTWETYHPQKHDLFARVVQGTYQDSFDCGSLNGIRDIEDILASHRATGRFDPDFWLVGLAGADPVGVVLLSHMPEQSAYEVVYMGLLPQWRGKGYGAALLDKAVELAADQAALRLTLAADIRNIPALKRYGQFGFRELYRRDAWIKILPASDGSLRG